MLDRANTKPSPPARAAEKSSAALNAEYEKQIAARDAAAAEFELLKDGRAAAKRGGKDALRAHKQKMEDVEDSRDVAAQLADDLKAKRDDAIECEREEARVAAYDAVQKEADAWAAEVLATYEDSCRKQQNLMARGKEIQDRLNLVCGDLPKGRKPLPHVEEKIRWIPAEPDREVEIEVERDVPPVDGHYFVGQVLRKQKVKERRVIKGSAAIRPAPLWECFQAAGLKPGDPGFGVRGVPFRALR